MDDDNFKVIRKNLNILSALIMLLAFADAEINKINFLGIAIDLEGERVYLALFFLYGYFIWRYLTKLPLRSGFVTEFHQFLMNYPTGLRKEYNTEKHRSKVLNREVLLLEDFLGEEPKIIELNIHRDGKKPINQLVLGWKYRNKDGKTHDIHENLSVSWFYISRKFIYFCFKHDKFGDFIFPLIPVLVNIIFFLFNGDWQGGIQNYLFTEGGQPMLLEDEGHIISD
ncbi:MAG: hypothetical protein RLO17_13750 [Cyclobacteriaceae bacterium]